MKSRTAISPLPLALVLLALLLCAPRVAISQAAASDPVTIAPGARAKLAQAAADSGLAPWQREVMLRVARTGTASAPGTPAAISSTPRTALGNPAGAWTLLQDPGDLFRSAIIYDPLRDRLVIFGGIDYMGAASKELWTYSQSGASGWTRLTPSGASPPARSGHTAIYDPVRDRMVVFGGSGAVGTFNDVWALGLNGTPVWTKLSPGGTAPPARLYHSAVYDSVRDRMVVFGGQGASYFNDVWVLSFGDTSSWVQVSPLSTPPDPRSHHGAIYDPVRDRMLVFGGGANDVWALSLAGTPDWTQLMPAGTPPSPRIFNGQGAIYDPV